MQNLLFKYLNYLLQAKNAHGIHSPFVYSLYNDVIKDRKTYPAYKQIETLRKHLKKDSTQLTITDFGAGGQNGNTYLRTVKDIATRAAKSPKYGQLLFRLCRHFGPQNMLELGTSLGISGAYQALGAAENNTINFISLEGSKEIAAVANANFKKLGLDFIQSGVGNFDETLPQYLKKFSKLDYVFFDGNHRKEPTLRYFSQCLPLAHPNTLFVFDDINWSEEMIEAWQEIKNHPQVTITIDLFFIGLVFFKKGHAKEHFTLRF